MILRKCRHWAFVPQAKVIWRSPERIKGIWNKLSSWSAGDGESGAFAPRYWASAVQCLQGIFWSSLALLAAAASFWIHPLVGAGCSAVVILGILRFAFGFGRRGERLLDNVLTVIGRMARVHGFLKGVRNRPTVIARQFAHVSGVTFMLSGVPIDDTGGGARGTQIALEAMRRGNLVVFVHKYPKQESVDLQIDYSSRNLLHFSAEDFDWKAFYYEHRALLEKKPLQVILEFPFPDYLPIVRDLKKRGATVVYDLIDEWNTSLGGDWYSPEGEQAVIDNSDVLSASAPSLVQRLEAASGRQVLFLPNAVNLHVFDRSREYPCPTDLPQGEPRILYIGALWGEWFEWDLIKELAQAYPKAATVLIGDYHGQRPDVEAVATFLGLKPQTELPAYLAHSDVAIIPWEISPITQATSPLKVFEYVTMGVPVVAPDLDPLKDIPYVFLSKDRQHFIENIRRARAVKVDGHVVDGFAQQNSWTARLDALQSRIDLHRRHVTKD